MKKQIISMLLIFTLVIISAGCTPTANTGATGDVKNLMENISTDTQIEEATLTESDAKKLMGLSIGLFNRSYEGENTLVSPLSIISALGMTANGAREETLKEFENFFGLGSMEEFNKYIAAYSKGLPNNEKYKFNLANSIWLNSGVGFTPNEEFLKLNGSYYNAEIYEAPFSGETKDAINAWVNENTDEMIPKILEEIDSGTIMYLINALAFDAEWQRIYNESDIFTDKFTKEDGSSSDVEFMYSKESKFLQGDNYTGFIKDYKDGKYSFVAVLPNEDIKMADFIKDFNYELLYENLANPVDTEVHATLPKFSYAFSTSLSETLKAMGLETAFDTERADFSGMGTATEGKVFIGDVLHKTFIEVNEKGTRAGAVTAVVMETTSAPMDYHEVRLDRAFMYMIVERETNLPMFIGTLMSVEKSE